eukprot:m.237604 g.237604  ORF g.237604 m.237604 type:complete len:327 (-) comp21233_c0_seq1:28-1008(-)
MNIVIFFLGAISLALPSQGDLILYKQPQYVNLSAQAWADPTTALAADETQLVFWRMGSKIMPADWDLSALTGVAVPKAAFNTTQRGVPHASTEQAGELTAVQDEGSMGASTSSTVQYYNGTFGAYLNTYLSPPIQGNLATLIISNDWSSPVHVWARSGAGVRVTLSLAVPQASKAPSSAIYVTTSFGLHHYTGSGSDAFVWYETSIFDLDRAQSEWVNADTISKQAIIHGVLNGPGNSRYHTQTPGSSNASSQVFPTAGRFQFSVCASHLVTGLTDVHTRMPSFNLPLDAAGWAITHINIELEALAGAQAGYHVSDLTVESIDQCQ